MREQTIEDGKVVASEGVRRGRPIVYTEGEWAWRSRHYYLWGTWFVGSLLVFCWVVALTSLYVLQLIVDWMTFELEFVLFILAFLPLFTMVAVVATCVGLWNLRSRRRSGFPVPGLYEHGLETPTLDPRKSLFTPYPELGRVDASRVWWIRYYDVDLTDGRTVAQVNRGFLGDLGYQALQLEIQRAKLDEGEEAPELILYGRMGGVVPK